MAAEYTSAGIYIRSKTTLLAKIAACEAIMDTLLTTVVTAAENNDVDEYWLDDGQTKIKTKYRSSKEVMESYEAVERVRQIYVNRYNGRSVRLIPGKNFIEPC